MSLLFPSFQQQIPLFWFHPHFDVQWLLFGMLVWSKKNMLIHVTCCVRNKATENYFVNLSNVHWNWYWWLIFSSLLQESIVLSTELTLIICFASLLVSIKYHIFDNQDSKMWYSTKIAAYELFHGHLGEIYIYKFVF